MPEDLPDRMPDRMSEDMPEDMPDRVPEDMPEQIAEDMPARMPEDMPDRMPEDMPEQIAEDMPARMPEDMPDRMPEDMPDKMPEGMSDRMPEGLPVTKCINVMVGITRSKVIFVVASSMCSWLWPTYRKSHAMMLAALFGFNEGYGINDDAWRGMTASKISRRHAIKISRRQQRKKWGFAFLCYKTRFCFRCFQDATVRSASVKCEESLRLALHCTGVARRSCSWTTTLQQLRTKHARTGLAGTRHMQVLEVVLGSDSWKALMTYEKRWAGIRWEELRWDEVWNLKCGVWRVQCEAWGVKSAVWRVKCEVWSVKWEVWSVKIAGRSVKCGLWSVKCGVLRVQCEVKCGVRRVQCEVWSVECQV